mgnify:CR=1 FL=1
MDEIFQVYGTSFDDIAPGINQRVQETAVAGEDYLTTLQRILSSLALTYQQQQLMALNIERARRGQPPVDIAQYSGIGVNVGLSTGTQQLVMYGGIALLALLALQTVMKGR